VLFYATMIIVSTIIALIFIWFYRIVFGFARKTFKSQLPGSEHHPAKKLDQKRYGNKSHSSSARRKSLKDRLIRDHKLAVGHRYHHDRHGLSGSAYKPSQKAISKFALDTKDEEL
jgi:hypothetical protein